VGSIRTILALAVVFTHAGAVVFTGGVLAVQLFYIVSGYLMSLVILSSSYSSIKLFYLNRFLRLFPIYWFVALITLVTYFSITTEASVEFFKTYTDLGDSSVWLILANILLVGQDWIMFTGVTDGIFGFTTNFLKSDIPIWRGLLVPQAWTLGVELSFYAIAPFILKNWKHWVSLLILSLLLRVYFIFIGLGKEDPFSYRFFPLELALFLFGVLAHQAIRPFYERLSLLDNSVLIKSINFFILSIILIFHLIPISTPIKTLLFIGVFVVSLPMLAKFQRENRLDNWIGNLSYQIYICHWLIIDIMKLFFDREDNIQNILYFFFVILSTIIFAIFLEKVINSKVDVMREIVRNRK
jgi:peptidoglycan/LPS O-acetylase OafA/YrhL